ncbi:hypothetical protein [Pseudescherichia sp.]|uniref:hypothetical protein n=1 Tax=Pseudescherichia sp. TaxID=2055881 RepID=UPI0028ABF6E9|nr:hypothetical protein [Pseudescherichia sp.]
MKLPLACAQCMQEDIMNAMTGTIVGFNDDGRYEVTCQKGHSSITILQQQKYEILFEIGAYAIIDGYYREAVSSFSSALERYYEFFIKVICISKGVDMEKSLEAWKEVSKQSERQLGAFIFIHLLETGSKPTLLKSKLINFRNEVIHKGKIPSRDEAVEYGQAVLDVIQPLIKKLRENHSKAIATAIAHHVFSTRHPYDDALAVSTTYLTTILSLSYGESTNSEVNLNEAISKLRRW